MIYTEIHALPENRNLYCPVRNENGICQATEKHCIMVTKEECNIIGRSYTLGYINGYSDRMNLSSLNRKEKGRR